MSDDANDVTKALAAFGAPSIRYRSFGQSQMRPAGVPLPRSPVVATVSPALPVTGAEPLLTQQDEPVAAPESLNVARLAPYPTPIVTPQPAPVFAAPPTVAPPPRPLAEWAAPASVVPMPAPAPAPVQLPLAVAPLVYTAPPASSPPPPRPAPPLVAAAPLGPAPLVYPRAAMPPVVTTRRSETVSTTSSLAEVFEFLAAS